MINIIRRDLEAVGFNNLEEDVLQVYSLLNLKSASIYWTRSPFTRTNFATRQVAEQVMKYYDLRDCCICEFTNDPK